MARLPGVGGGEPEFDPPDAFVPAHLPEPGPFLDGQDVLTGAEHLTVHRTAAECFEERGVYDMTFGYNLARLNRDPRHPGAGYRYAVETGRPSVLRAEFTPTTPFCPQSDTLSVGSFRAWNGLSDQHAYDLVRIRVAPMHHQSEAINAKLERHEERFEATGALEAGADPDRVGGGFDHISHGDPAEER